MTSTACDGHTHSKEKKKKKKKKIPSAHKSSTPEYSEYSCPQQWPMIVEVPVLRLHQ